MTPQGMHAAEPYAALRESESCRAHMLQQLRRRQLLKLAVKPDDT
jgi:hypothetical protein